MSKTKVSFDEDPTAVLICGTTIGVSVDENSPPLYFFALNQKGPLIWEDSPKQN